MKRARDDPVNKFIDLEARVGDDDEEDEEDKDNDGTSAGVPYSVPVQAYHLLGGFIDEEPAVNPHYTPLRQMDETSDREGGWHDLVASLEERYASDTSKFNTTHHIAEDNCRNEQPLDLVIVSAIENIIAHDYPFWRVRCKVTDSVDVSLILSNIHLLTSQAQRKRWLVFYARWQRHGTRCEPPSSTAQ